MQMNQSLAAVSIIAACEEKESTIWDECPLGERGFTSQKVREIHCIFAVILLTEQGGDGLTGGFEIVFCTLP
jgi:hypothetical protein